MMVVAINFGLLCLLIGSIQVIAEPTRVYNAKARSTDGTHDMNIQVIQVGIINLDQAGRHITVTPPPVEVHAEIKDRVAWSPETGFVVRKPPVVPDPDKDISTVEFTEDGSNSLGNALVPSIFQNYYPNVASTHVSSRRRKPQTNTLLEIAIAGLVALVFLVILIILFVQFIRKRAAKKNARKADNTMVYYQPINGQRNFIRPDAVLDREPSTTASHDYENMSDLDETSEVSVRPPPIPPRRARMGMALNQHLGHRGNYAPLDQPVAWLLDTSISSRNSPASSVLRLKLNTTNPPTPPPRPPPPTSRRRGSM